MRYLSVCSGIEAASVAFKPLGWQPVGFSEIEPFPCRVLAHHYPDVPNFGDLTKWREWNVPGFDVLCGGTPCQGFSVAGKRGGMDDPRSQLAWDFLGLAGKYRPRWILWENVPGVLSSNGGRDFGAFLGRLGQCGYGFAYAVLDAQYFGLAQRRKRVFVVGYLGDWRPACAVLLDRESMSGNPAPRREAGQGTTAELAKCLRGRSNASHREDSANYVADAVPIQYAEQLGREKRQNGMGLGDPGDPMFTLECRQPHGVAHAIRTAQTSANGHGVAEDVSHTLDGANGQAVSMCLNAGGMGRIDAESETLIPTNMAVRRLTPRECERLQGFPDDYTLVPHRSKPAADGPRYKALGNSWAVPCAAWIARRIIQVESLM